MDDRDAIRIGEQVTQFIGAVAIIDVVGDRPQLAGRNKRLKIGWPVKEIEPDGIAPADPLRGQARGKSIAAIIELGKGQLFMLADYGYPVRNGQSDRFEQVSKMKLTGHR